MARIAIDYTPAHEQSAGIGRLVRDLVAALAQIDHTTDYRLFVAGATQPNIHQSLPPNYKWKPSRITPKWFARLWHRLQIPLNVENFVGRDIDLYHATDFVLPPTRAKTRTILTVHDLSFVKVPEAASARLKEYLDHVVPRSIANADHVIADSEATKVDIVELYDVKPTKISVLLSGVNSHFKPIIADDNAIRTKYKLPNKPFIFTIGTVQPRKNYGRLAEALSQLHQRNVDVDLVIAGGRGWLEDEIYQKIDELDLKNRVHFIGFADDDDLPSLYSMANCVAFPSLYEGFGFPVLESMACGTPVLTSNVSSLPEVAGDAAIMIDPYDVDDIANGLLDLIQDSNLRETLTQRGFKQAQQFSWEKSAHQLIKIYQAVLTGTA